MTSRLSVKTISLSFLFVLLFAFCSIITKAQINVVYKDKKADTLKLFENKKVLIDQLSQKEAQNSVQIEKINEYTRSLAKANDSLAFGLSQLKKEVDGLNKAPAALPVVPIMPPVHQPISKPLTPWKPVLPAQPVLPPNVVPVYIASYFNLRLDSIKALNEKLNERVTILQDAVSHLKARPALATASEPSHTLIYVLLGVLGMAVLFLFFTRSPQA